MRGATFARSLSRPTPIDYPRPCTSHPLSHRCDAPIPQVSEAPLPLPCALPRVVESTLPAAEISWGEGGERLRVKVD